MFSKRAYHEVNREERFYCFLLGHALLASPTILERFKDLARREIHVSLGDEAPEVFVEVAALRDYWNDLGDPEKYHHDTDAARRQTLEAALQVVNVSPSILGEHDFFFTVPHRKLWSPGRWNVPDLMKGSDLGRNLQSLKWAFNCKPDMMIDCGGGPVLVIEAKVGSGEGRTSDGYVQCDVQETVVKLLKHLVPACANSQFTNTTLTLRGKDLRWADIEQIVADDAGVDSFTKRCFKRLARENADLDQYAPPAPLHPPA